MVEIIKEMTFDSLDLAISKAGIINHQILK